MKSHIVWLMVSVCVLCACEQQKYQEWDPIPVDYQSWHQPLKQPIEYAVVGHGESRRIIYVNELALQAKHVENKYGQKLLRFPNGAIIIKEVFRFRNNGYEPHPQVVSMVKDTNDPKAQDGWLYYVRNPNNPQVKQIDSRLCSGCHEAANESHPYFDNNPNSQFRDYVFIDLVK